MVTNRRREQVKHALPIAGSKGIEENQSLNLSWVNLCHTADDHVCGTVAYEDHF
jgi:hypothetical protein